MSAYDDLQAMYANLISEVSEIGLEGPEKAIDLELKRNLTTPITRERIERIYGTAENQLATYENFRIEYTKAIEEELNRGIGLSESRIRDLRAAMKADSPININLLSTIESRRALVDKYMNDVLQIKTFINQFGLPAESIPSSNPNTMVARLANLVADDATAMPIVQLLRIANFQIDPFAGKGRTTALEKFRVGTTSLPSLTQLQQINTSGTPFNIPPSNAKVFFGDVETTGVTTRDYVRSFSLTGGDPLSESSEMGARFITPEMQGYTAADPENLKKSIGFGEVVVKRETNLLEGPITGKAAQKIIDENNIFDLTTESGRVRARQYYTDRLTMLSADDAYFAAYNARFDVQMLSRSARAMGVSEEVIEKFDKRMATGGMVDILEIVRERMASLASEERNKTQVAGEGVEDLVNRARRVIVSETMENMSLATGEAVKPLSLESVIQRTNFLELLANGSQEERELFETLQKGAGSHVDIVDTRVAQALYGFVTAQDPKLRLDIDASLVQNVADDDMAKAIKQIRINTLASRALVPTTTIADPRYLSQAMFDQIIESEEALRKVEIFDPERGLIKYDKEKGTFRAYSGLSSEGEDLPYKEWLRKVKETVEEARFDPEKSQRKMIGLGVNQIQSTNVEIINSLIKSGVNFGKIVESTKTEDILEALTSTRALIGFNYVDGGGQMTSSEIRSTMRGQYDSISRQERIDYSRRLARIGLGAPAMDAQVRASVVGIATVLSQNLSKNEGLVHSLMREAYTETLEDGSRALTITPQVLEGKVQSTISALRQNAHLLSETGIFSVQGSAKASLSDSVIIATIDDFKKMQTIIGEDVVSLFDEINDGQSAVQQLNKRFADSQNNYFRFSVASPRKEDDIIQPVVNIIFGGNIDEKDMNAVKRANQEADSLYDALSNRFASQTDAELIAEGFAENQEQLNKIKGQVISLPGASVNEESRENFRRIYRNRGVVVASLDEATSAQLIPFIEDAASGIDSDTIALQKGLKVSIAHVSSEGQTTFVPAQGAEQTAEAVRLGQQGAEEVSSPAAQMDNLGKIFKRSSEEDGFFERLGNAMRSAKKGSKYANQNLIRREEILERWSKIRPNIYKGVLGLGILSAGYYIGRRAQENDAYNEVMDEQEYSSPAEQGFSAEPQFRRFNQQSSSQYSYRRDPLVTAGVVGGLDRNKVSHHKMGAGKYSHLYGTN